MSSAHSHINGAFWRLLDVFGLHSAFKGQPPASLTALNDLVQEKVSVSLDGARKTKTHRRDKRYLCIRIAFFCFDTIAHGAPQQLTDCASILPGQRSVS